ncbi:MULTISPECIES: transcription factor FapR [Virgibacillus]|uniref:Transcription factor FapR n=2 Tax=Virgibacillus TaxID=84406 RepID=A0A024QD26_9BACI|nr:MULTISPECIES: transcription factor FapR [Virgibacillus]EQB36454.1 DeoR family transcriptional regulator [Virgibacillus sp. CM-4]MYL42287.1 transcription factor FapR [Virgibacillus massiliensis]GGJ43755.1 transcription factor FapR [Virgibacillus kapii]CDQ40152.1 Fatty acid and phospholipid biosynthesis regulator [Virgibacillus massiliensis]
MKRPKADRQRLLKDTIEQTPFITDEELAKKFEVSIQTIRLDRMELSIPELRQRIKSVATDQWNETVKALPLEEVIGEVIDLELDSRAISILDIGSEHVFSRNKIARGHHLFAQANSLAVAVINDELALTAKSELKFTRQVNEGERVIAKATVEGKAKGLTLVQVQSFVENEMVFTGNFHMYQSNEHKGEH